MKPLFLAACGVILLLWGCVNYHEIHNGRAASDLPNWAITAGIFFAGLCLTFGPHFTDPLKGALLWAQDRISRIGQPPPAPPADPDAEALQAISGLIKFRRRFPARFQQVDQLVADVVAETSKPEGGGT